MNIYLFESSDICEKMYITKKKKGEKTTTADKLNKSLGKYDMYGHLTYIK